MQSHLDPSESWFFLTIDPSWSLKDQTAICFRRTPQRSVHLRLVLQTAQRTSKEPGRQLGSKAVQNDGITVAEVHWWDTKGLGRGLEGAWKGLESDSEWTSIHLKWHILIANYITFFGKWQWQKTSDTKTYWLLPTAPIDLLVCL